ncbi:hypothetical protein GF359_03915, partial [candidate division WOR-3 bacterium]|nr:hypothetical protein [candidate division WOR-3 bacterium]MBD3364343.1 hypothetical protein [candidate division WOR-3 bacterium]
MNGSGRPQTGGALNRDYGPEDFLRLLRFYRGCIEEEDLQSLSLPLDRYRKSFISPWGKTEPLFHPVSSSVSLEVNDKLDKKFLTRGIAQAGEKERFFYGYPTFIDNKDYITPLFFLEVEVEVDQENGFIMRPVDWNAIQLNYHLFIKQGIEVEEIRVIQEELEGSFGSFQKRLEAAAAFKRLGVEPSTLTPDKVDTLPNRHSCRNCWVNRPILFRSEWGIYNRKLLLELDKLVKVDSLRKNVMETAIGPLLSSRKITISEEYEGGHIEVLPLNERQEEALKSSTHNPLTVVTGPP